MLATAVSVDEYLNSSYTPDMEYVDGVLVERSVPTFYHSLLQMILGSYFRAIERDYRIKTLSELRTQIIERARYRIPDILLCRVPTQTRTIFREVPLVVIELLSPDDKMKDIMARFRDYEDIGVPHLILLDPEDQTAHRYQKGSLVAMTFVHLVLPPPRPGQDEQHLPFDTNALFAQLRDEIAEAGGNL